MFERKKIVIVGGGFGGLHLAKNLKGLPFDVLLIDKTNHHLFQPLLYQVATASLSPADIGTPLREILRHQKNISVLMDEVLSVDKNNKSLLLKSTKSISYDFLVLAVGTIPHYFGNNSWETFAPGLKTIADAIYIREKILHAFEKAESLTDENERKKQLTFVIIGGGPTGVEMAGSIAEIAHTTMRNNFRRLDPSIAKIHLVEALPSILPMYSPKLSLRAKKDLEKLGVIVCVGKKVAQVTKEGVHLEDSFIATNNIIWAAGNKTPPFLSSIGTPLDRMGRVIVSEDLSIPHFPEIFVIGDAACTLDKEKKPLPCVAPVAIQQGRHVALILRNIIYNPRSRPPFTYFDKGSMATIGKGKAVAKIGSFEFAGFFAWLTWCFVRIFNLINYRSRLGVILEWCYLYCTSRRGARLIYVNKEKAP